MGIWGTGLYANDCALDVKESYIEFLQQQLSDEEAIQGTLEKFQEYIETEDEPFLWYALADTQWKKGRLTPEIKEKALGWINKDGGLEHWADTKNEGVGWKKTLSKLREELMSPMAPKKKIRKPIEFVLNPWNVGDVQAYQFHTDFAKERGLFGKYILFQKIGDTEWCEKTLSIIQVFDRVFDEPPELTAIEGARVLPLTNPPGFEFAPKSIAEYVPAFERNLKAFMIYDKKSDYPKDFFTFIGNQSITAINYPGNKLASFCWDKDRMEDWLCEYYVNWQNIKY